ncbi:F-box/LRR-repeat protein 6 isoform X2 [Scomber scombrus]|uniref:F-box/LRR-repeat protein 6 isoform X2 n=1 Tax=Scomber scombrus TaxID=13677 RepID=A0AAV1PIT7_SCOSC
MDSTEAEVAAHGEESKDTVPSTSNVSDQGEHGPKSTRASLKRNSGSATNRKAKKRKTTRVKRSSQPSYTVHEGEDMLLVISSSTSQYDGSAWVPKKKGSKKKKLVKGKGKTVQIKKKKPVSAKPKLTNDYNKVAKIAKEEEATSVFVPEKARDNRWGQSLPEEVLINIFQMLVIQDGAVPFLCRFSQLRDFSLCHWNKNVDYAVDVVSQFCPHLRSLTFSYCTGMKAQAFQSLGLHSRSLQSINLQHSEFQVEGGLLEYLVNHGNQIRQILFTRGPKNDRLLTAITGCCPDLEFLEVNKKLDSKDCELPICIQALQIACPKLKTFRMLNVRLLHRTMRNGAELTSGFPLLEELCIATTSYSYMTDKDLLDILFSSTKLRVLDLRGCSRITPAGLATLPCLELECLFWGQYFSSHIGLSTLKKGLHMVTQKWNQTLQQLDIANQLFSEEDLEIAMSNLAQATDADTLRSLNLSGTRITPPALRSVIGQLTALSYLNLSSCRYLPRGVKRVYRGQEDIRQLLDKLE